MHSNDQIVEMVSFLTDKLSLDKEFGSHILFNNRRYCGDSKYARNFNAWIEKGFIKVDRYYIIDRKTIRENENLIRDTRIFKKLPRYGREGESHNLSLAYIYENISPNLTVQIGKKFKVLYSVFYAHEVKANLFVEECDLIITKDNESFNDFFNLLLIENTKLCIISTDDIKILTAFIIEKSDEFNIHIKDFILTENEINRKEMELAIKNNPFNI